MQKKWRVAERKDSDIKKHLMSRRGFGEADLNPPSPKEILPELFDLFPQIDKAVQLILKAAGEGRPLVIHGDYDADGISATAILWEALYYDLGYKNTHPFIPNRFDHGYGLSKESLAQIEKDYPRALIITVDCGITSIKEVAAAKDKGFEVVVTDHHQPSTGSGLTPGEKKPKADAILWTDKLSGAGIAWVLSQAFRVGSSKEEGLDLVALATIADIQPLTGFNRSLVKQGLLKLNQTQRVGLQELVKVSGIQGKKITPFEVGWVLAPRINASGRLKDAKEALRLLVTTSKPQAFEVAAKLDTINRERQKLTLDQYELARQKVLALDGLPNILWVASPDFHEGIIGLVAGKLSREFYRPAVVAAVGKDQVKASARSIAGVNIIELLRRLEHLSSSMGGHTGAAGFALAPGRVGEFADLLAHEAVGLDKHLFEPMLNIDAILDSTEISFELLEFLESLSPFGEGNPTPRFALEKVVLKDFKLLGASQTHLKMQIEAGAARFTALWFSYPQDIKPSLKIGAVFDLAFIIKENRYNGKRELQLIVKDIKLKDAKNS